MRTKHPIRVALASREEREEIYRLRHEVYAEEIHQHASNREGRLKDLLDDFNVYITASLEGELAGFISITPPGSPRFSIDKYLDRPGLPFPCDRGLHEVRLLTVRKSYRSRPVAPLLMYAALRWVEGRGGQRIAALGRREVLGLYRKAGLEAHGQRVTSGQVVFELLSARTSDIADACLRRSRVLARLRRAVDWQLDVPFQKPAPCFHGGEFFRAIGEDFDSLERSRGVINADVLDAWFPPSPRVTEALEERLPWLLRTSPPTACEGLVRTISRVRGIPADCVVPGAGSSDLIFRTFLSWLRPGSRVLLLDPTYGEYSHVTERVIGCRVDRLPLLREDGYRLELRELTRSLGRGYDLVVIVNPNSPTGCHVPRRRLEEALLDAPMGTKVWVDETYVEYAGPGESLESFAARSRNVVVAKSMSKVYALSGARVAYLCAPPWLAAEVRAVTPPWVVGLPGQVAAVKALGDREYYRRRYAETRVLRGELARELRSLGMEVLEGAISSLLCDVSRTGRTAASLVESCRARNLYLRDASRMSALLGPGSVRIAVKDRVTNHRMVEVLREVLRR